MSYRTNDRIPGSDAAARRGAGAVAVGPVPSARGDGRRLPAGPARGPPARIAIIDGLFEQVPAVWHKELLFAMARGVEVSGAASMGALRAAELHAFGMIGVGPTFAAYKSGRAHGRRRGGGGARAGALRLPALLGGDGQRARRPGARPPQTPDRRRHPRSPARPGQGAVLPGSHLGHAPGGGARGQAARPAAAGAGGLGRARTSPIARRPTPACCCAGWPAPARRARSCPSPWPAPGSGSS